MRLKGDTTVKAAIDNSILRESQWTHKGSTVIACEAIHTHALNLHCPAGDMPILQELSGKERAKLSHDMKASVKKKVFSDLHEEQKKHLDTLLKQGDYLSFSEQEKYDPNWKSVIYNLPKGTMKFLLNSFTNTLPTQDNLKLWGKNSVINVIFVKTETAPCTALMVAKLLLIKEDTLGDMIIYSIIL